MIGARLNPRLAIALLSAEVIAGLDGLLLARAAGISAATLSTANRGARISPRTIHRIAEALSRQPIVAGAEELLAVAD